MVKFNIFSTKTNSKNKIYISSESIFGYKSFENRSRNEITNQFLSVNWFCKNFAIFEINIT